MAKNNKKNKKKIIPKEMTVLEASEFWDEHSLIEFENTEEVEVKFKLDKKHYIGINQETFKRLKDIASREKTTPEALVEFWLAEKMEQVK